VLGLWDKDESDTLLWQDEQGRFGAKTLEKHLALILPTKATIPAFYKIAAFFSDHMHGVADVTSNTNKRHMKVALERYIAMQKRGGFNRTEAKYFNHVLATFMASCDMLNAEENNHTLYDEDES
jgi:hypothetical protein